MYSIVQFAVHPIITFVVVEGIHCSLIRDRYIMLLVSLFSRGQCCIRICICVLATVRAGSPNCLSRLDWCRFVRLTSYGAPPGLLIGGS